ncbi:MAG: carbohydrate porin [Candidatus Hydrogenedentota bacterium]|nr:MAG: carbohydrate porin [Candidatus Hydrogenedentota bacterium]
MGQPAANPVGGERQGTNWLNDVSLAAFLDLQRLMDWKGGFFTASFGWKSGDKLGLTPESIGNQFPVQLSTGGNATRLVRLAVGQELFDNDAELVGGRIITGEDFATIRLACTSLNQAICANPIAGNQSISFPTYPNAVWGGRLKYKPGISWYAQIGAYLVYPDFRNPNDHGVNFGAPEGSGVLTLGEYGYIVGSYRGKPGLPGKYKIGGYYDGEKLRDLKTNQPERGTWGIYGLAEQMVYAEDDKYDQGLSAWLALSYAPPDRNRIEFMAAGGLSYKGIFPGRPRDALSFISSYGRYSSDLRAGQRARRTNADRRAAA